MSVLDDRVQQLLKHLIGLFISRHTANSHNKGVAYHGNIEAHFNMQIEAVSLKTIQSAQGTVSLIGVEWFEFYVHVQCQNLWFPCWLRSGNSSSVEHFWMARGLIFSIATHIPAMRPST